MPSRVNMSGTARHRHGSLSASLLVTFLLFTLGSAPAWPAVGGGHGGGLSGGGHGGGFGRGAHGGLGGGHSGGSFPQSRESGGGGFGGRHDHDRDGRRFFLFPYYVPYYGYDPNYPYYPYDSYHPYYPYDAYCDPYSPYYAPQYC